MNRRIGIRLGLASAAAIAGVAITLVAPWDAGASWPAAGREAGLASHADRALAAPETLLSPVVDPVVRAVPTPGLAEPPSVQLTQVQLPITYHPQQTGDWCDPADIEMWFQADGIGMSGLDDYAIQERFWNYELANNDGYTLAQWNASPYAVAVTLDHFSGWEDIGDDPQPTVQAAGTVISYSLDVLQQPVIVMVGAGTHYVLVTGVTLGPGGADAPPVAVSIDDPLAYGVATGPPAGTGASEEMSWDDFTSWYTPNTNHGGVWANQYVLIAAGIPLVG
jgi:hypothetical protein